MMRTVIVLLKTKISSFKIPLPVSAQRICSEICQLKKNGTINKIECSRKATHENEIECFRYIRCLHIVRNIYYIHILSIYTYIILYTHSPSITTDISKTRSLPKSRRRNILNIGVNHYCWNINLYYENISFRMCWEEKVSPKYDIKFGR